MGSGERKGGRAELHDYCMTAFLAICISSLEHPCTIDETHSPRATRGSRASLLSGETDSYDRELRHFRSCGLCVHARGVGSPADIAEVAVGSLSVSRARRRARRMVAAGLPRRAASRAALCSLRAGRATA